ncbi:unnamed protein product [Lampetra planeri]
MPPAAVVFNSQAVTSRLGVVRVLQVAFTCVAFSLVAHSGGKAHSYGDFCMFAWCACFACSLLMLLLELFGQRGCAQISWQNLTVTYAMLAALLLLSASVLHPVYRLREISCGNCEPRTFTIVATVFSCLAFLAYAAEVALTRARPGEVTGYMASVPGLLKVLEAFVACLIFVVLADRPGLYSRYPALQWCLAVYCICFVLVAVVILLTVCQSTGRLCLPFDRFLALCGLVAVLAYVTAAVLWPVYCFSDKYGEPRRSSSYCRDVGSCDWDMQLAVTVFTYVNLLAYVADMVYSSRLVIISRTL